MHSIEFIRVVIIFAALLAIHIYVMHAATICTTYYYNIYIYILCIIVVELRFLYIYIRCNIRCVYAMYARGSRRPLVSTVYLSTQHSSMCACVYV